MAETILLCPRNDEESLLILKIAAAAQIPSVVSPQPHGARLGHEDNLVYRLKQASLTARRVVIVEIPGPDIERELEELGYDVVIIDHHRYNDLDRMQPLSSLEQFLQVFALDNDRLVALGFDPELVVGVGMIDRGFVWELKKEGLPLAAQKRIRAYYVSLMQELGGPSEEAWAEAKRAWEARQARGDFFIVRSERNDVKIREALSFLLADEYTEPPQVLIVEGNGRLSLQDSKAAADLFAAFGGFTFGKDLCWGLVPETGKEMPSIDEIFTVLDKPSVT